MLQSLEYFKHIEKKYNKKILILGDMNELGKNSHKMHLHLLQQVDKYNFKFIILCGEFLRRSIKKLNNQKNKFIYFDKKNEIMKFLKKNILNNDIILIKCSNSTEINAFTMDILKKR